MKNRYIMKKSFLLLPFLSLVIFFHVVSPARAAIVFDASSTKVFSNASTVTSTDHSRRRRCDADVRPGFQHIELYLRTIYFHGGRNFQGM